MVLELKEFLAKKLKEPDIFDREILITPIYASFNQLSFFIFTCQGCPPRATIIVSVAPPDERMPLLINFVTIVKKDGTIRKIEGNQYNRIVKVFEDFINEFREQILRGNMHTI